MIGWIALAISALAFASQIYTAARDRPRLGVVTRADVGPVLGMGVTVYAWHITVINHGRHAQAIDDVGVVGKNPTHTLGVRQLRELRPGVSGPDFPAIVPPYGYLDWIVPGKTVSSHFPRLGQELRGYVARFSTKHRYEVLNRVAAWLREHGPSLGTVHDYEREYRQTPR